MSAELDQESRLEIAHVLFMDIVGYSKLRIDAQSELLQKLNQLVRSTEQFRTAEAADKLVRLPTGDGMALAFFTSPDAPVRCALEMGKALKKHPDLPLRMGINSGPVDAISDVNDRSNVAGAGINMAQRVMDCGDAGHILLSHRVADDLGQYSRWEPHLYDLGEVEVKHGVKISVVNLYTDDAGNPELPEKLKRTRQEHAEIESRAVITRRRNRILSGALVLFLAAAIAAFWIYFRDTPSTVAPAPLASGAPEKSIAVLPFENFSTDKENVFLADGIQDDLLTNLAKIKDLRVISRTSVMKYRNADTRNIQEIGKTLDAAHVLEGSVRRLGDRIAVNVQLIDSSTDRHIWAERYDRTIADAVGIEGELATEIAEALRATLTPEEKIRVEQKPTQNADAFVLYLRALPYEQGPDTLLQDYKRAVQLYTQAIALDPNFALAHARLASTYAEIFHFHEPLDSWKTKARSEAETALRLQSNLAEGHFALGQCNYWIDENYEEALNEFAIAQRLAPSNTRVELLVAAIKRRQGRWEECLAAFERIQRLDPENPNIVRNIVFTNTALRRWPEASRAVERLRAMAPDSLVAKIQAGYIQFEWKGDTTALRSELAQVPAGEDPDGIVTACKWDGAMLERDFARAQQVLAASPLTEVSYLNGGLTPKIFLVGCTGVALGDPVLAQKNFEAARKVFESAVTEAPNAAERHANLGLCYAFMGRKEDAIREGRRAVELKPETKDAYDGAILNCCLALIYARVGENELAIPLIERLLRTPGAVDSINYSITVNDLKFRWEWDQLRSDPAFQKLVSPN